MFSHPNSNNPTPTKLDNDLKYHSNLLTDQPPLIINNILRNKETINPTHSFSVSDTPTNTLPFERDVNQLTILDKLCKLPHLITSVYRRPSLPLPIILNTLKSPQKRRSTTTTNKSIYDDAFTMNDKKPHVHMTIAPCLILIIIINQLPQT